MSPKLVDPTPKPEPPPDAPHGFCPFMSTTVVVQTGVQSAGGGPGGIVTPGPGIGTIGALASCTGPRCQLWDGFAEMCCVKALTPLCELVDVARPSLGRWERLMELLSAILHGLTGIGAWMARLWALAFRWVFGRLPNWREADRELEREAEREDTQRKDG